MTHPLFARFGAGAALALGLVLAATAATPARAAVPAPQQHFTLERSFADALGGNALQPNGGRLEDGGYRFGTGQGLSLAGLPGSRYTLDFVLRIAPEANTGWGKLIDFQGRASDSGLYRAGQHLAFWDPTHLPWGQALPRDSLLRLTVTRDEADRFTTYVNGQAQLSFVDSAGRTRFGTPGAVGWFFQDDGQENLPGWLGELRVWHSALSPAQVAELGLPTLPPVPEPGTWALMTAGLALVLLLGGAPARAADCWVPGSTSTGPGFAAPAVAAAATRGAALLRAEPALGALAGVRLLTRSHLNPPLPERGQALPAAEVRVTLHRSAVWGPGCSLRQPQADHVSPATAALHLNSLGALFHALDVPYDASPKAWFASAEVRADGPGRFRVGERLRLLGTPGRPALVPVTVGQYLAYYEAQLQALQAQGAPRAGRDLQALRAQRQALDAATLATPAALGPQPEGAPEWAWVPAGGEGTVPLWRVNPALWAGAAAGTVRLVTLEVWLNDSQEPLAGALQAWLADIDTRPYQALLTP